eukprot:1147753-Pelagomonas_calceolata.AAC.16
MALRQVMPSLGPPYFTNDIQYRVFDSGKGGLVLAEGMGAAFAWHTALAGHPHISGFFFRALPIRLY